MVRFFYQYIKIMGITLNKTITLSNGLTVTNPYASVNNINVKKQLFERRVPDPDNQHNTETIVTTTKYLICGTLYIWVNQTQRESGSEYIERIDVKVFSSTPPTDNVYDILYNKIKSIEDYSDAI